MRNNLILFGKFTLGGILSYATPRFLVAIGVPVDRWIVKMANWFSLAITNEAALWSGGTIICAVLFGVVFALDRRHRLTTVIGPLELTQRNKSKRAPLIELRDYIASLPGWEEIGEGLQYLDLIKAFREAAHEERFEVWGRKKTSSGMFQSDEILRKIPAEYWEYASLDELRFPSRNENKDLCTYVIRVSRRDAEDTYWDLEVERVPAFEWAQHGAERYRGDEDRSSAAAQKEIQKISFTRDTKMHEALGYIEGGSWGNNLFEYMATPNPKQKGQSFQLVRQAALDGDIRVWGKLSESGPYSLIPAEYWKVWKIEWFSALKGQSETEIAEIGYHGGLKYHDFMVSKGEIEKLWPPKEP